MTTPRTQVDSGRLIGLDGGKALAAAAVVYLHAVFSWPATGLHAACRFAVPFFTICSVFLMVGSACRRSRMGYGRFVRQRFIRIYLPYLLWAAVYIGIRDLRALAGRGDYVNLNAGVLVTGLTLHLWFLPFIFLVLVAGYPIAYGLRNRPLLGTVLAGVGFFSALAIPSTPPSAEWIEFTLFANFCRGALPAAFLGAAAGFFIRAERDFLPRRNAWTPVLGGGVFLAINAATVWWAPFPRSLVTENLAGFGLFLALLPLRAPQASPFWAVIMELGRLSYGWYLVHSLFIELLQLVFNLSGPIDGTLRDVLVWTGTNALSIVVSWVLVRGRWSAWTVGEPTPSKQVSQ